MSENAKYSQTKLLAVMNVPSSTFYSHKAPKTPTQHDLHDAVIIEKIQEIVDANEFNNSYGIKRAMVFSKSTTWHNANKAYATP